LGLNLLLNKSINIQKIIKLLQQKYPVKKIILNPPKNPTEIICEISPTSEHPENSIALVIIGKSKPHYHKKSTEIYEVQIGILTVYVNGKKHILNEREKITINPNIIHYVEGNEAWFLTHSSPGWAHEDNILINK